MPQFRRTDRLNEALKQEISLLVRDEVRDPRVGLATITAVQTSPELDHAKVYFTALGDEAERAGILTGLRSAAPFIRSQLGKRMHMRRIPELHFEVDRVLEEAARIERLLREALPPEPIASADVDSDAESDVDTDTGVDVDADASDSGDADGGSSPDGAEKA
ncbi:MAG TPA: 30S ribosome-binding factor RbfA [Longimicrobium sp.]|nr:30S ribosome-binding factor RbfA [Longimicrobium sp.]